MTRSELISVFDERGGLVHRAELLVGVPGQGDFPDGVAVDEAGVELGDLPLAQVFSSAAEQPADLVQRVVLVAAPAQGVLLDPAPYFVDDLGAELDQVERVEHRDGVRELVADRVREATEGSREACLIPSVNGGPDIRSCRLSGRTLGGFASLALEPAPSKSMSPEGVGHNGELAPRFVVAVATT
jgi:hypothetical protein